MQTFYIANTKSKTKILLENQGLHDFRFLSLNELKNKLLGKLNNEAIYYLYNNYNYGLPFINKIKKYLPYIDINKNYKSTKLEELKEIKKALLKENLYERDNLFINNLANYNLIFIDILKTREFVYLINYLKENNVNYQINKKDNINKKFKVLNFNDAEEEIYYIFKEINNLLNKGVNPNNIYLNNVNDNYYPILKKMSYLYQVDIELDSLASLVDKEEFKLFYDNLNKLSLEDNISNINDPYLKKELITIANTYLLKDNENINFIKDIYLYSIRNVNYKTNKYENSIKIINNINNLNENDYLFILNFNLDYPNLKNNLDYLNENELKELGFINKLEENEFIINETINELNNVDNLIITKPLILNNEANFDSILVEKLKMKVLNKEYEFGANPIIDNLKLGMMLDDYSNYNIKTDELERFDIEHLKYLSYDNKFKPFKLNIPDDINLSYSSMKVYFSCAFHYYLDYVLKLSINEDTISTELGQYCHKILQDSYDPNFNLEEELIKNKEGFSAKTKFYASRFDLIIKRILEFNNSYETSMELNEVKREEKIEVKHNFLNLKGFIDKIRFKVIDNNIYLAIYDYKTGSDVVSLDNIEYGYNMQLPTYLYLLNNSPKLTNYIINFVGLYLQKVTLESLDLQDNIDKPFKLQGFTNSDRKIMELIDKNYTNSTYISGLKVTKDGNFSKSSKIFNLDDVKHIIEVVENNLKTIENSYLNCDFAINPKVIDNINSSCQYCPYSNICYKTFNDLKYLTKIPFKKEETEDAVD